MIVQNTSLHGTTDISFTVPKIDLADVGRGVPTSWATSSARPA